jgi:predicted  nucleic acid-binding Zn-ribbon protein
MTVQIVQNPSGYNNHCPKCGEIYDQQLVDDGEEVLLISACNNCGHTDLVRVK